MKKTEIEKLVSEITDFVNTYSLDQDLFNETMSHEHRTLQQSFTRLCLKWLEYVASEDFKNAEASDPKKKEYLKKLADSLEETDNPVLIVVTPKN